MAQESSLINLSKAIGIVLEKKKVPNVVVQVGTALDISGSTQRMYQQGVFQRLTDRLFALSYKFDDNQVLDSWAFHTDAYTLEPIVERMFGNYIKKYLLNNKEIQLWGGTCYLEQMLLILDHYLAPGAESTVASAGKTSGSKSLFGKIAKFVSDVVNKAAEPTGMDRHLFPSEYATSIEDPAYITFVTDGENDYTERVDIEILLEATKNHPVFWQFIGITQGSGVAFSWLEKIAAKYPQVAFYNANNVDSVSDNELYTELLNDKFINWYTNVRKAA